MPYNKEQLQRYIDQGLTRCQIAEILGVAPCTLTKHIKRLGLAFKHKGNFRQDAFTVYPQINEEWLFKNWVSTDKSLAQLAEEFNVPEGVLETRRGKYNLQKTYKYKVNFEKLFNINDPNVWYLAGLLVTDGYFPKVSNAFELTLVGPSEKHLLESLLQYFECTAPLQEYKPDNYRIRVCGKGIKEFFNNNFNIPILNKTTTADIPNTFLNEACTFAYIRGCIDGDGHFDNNVTSLTLVTASDKFIKNFGNLLEKLLHEPVRYFMQKGSKGQLYPGLQLHIAGVKKLYNNMYPDDSIYLQRKFLQCKNKFN